VLFVAVFTAMIGVGIIAPLLPVYAADLGASGMWIGIIFAGFSIARTMTMPVVGKASDIYGRKRFIVLGLFCYSAISLGYVAATDVGSLALIRFLHGLAASMVIPISMAYIGDLAPANREGATMGNFSIALFAGFGVGPLLGGVIKDTMSIEANFYGLGILAFIAFLLVLFFLPASAEQRGDKQEGPASYREILKSDYVRGLAIYRFVNALGRGALICFIPLFADDIGLSASKIGVLIGVNILLLTVLQSPFGYLADRVNRKALVVLGNLAAMFTFMLFPLCDSFAELFAASLLMGAASAVSLPAASAMVVEQGQRFGMGSVVAVFNLAMSGGLALGPMAGGLIMDAASVGAIFWFAAVVLLLGNLGFVYYIRKGSRAQATEVPEIGG